MALIADLANSMPPADREQATRTLERKLRVNLDRAFLLLEMINDLRIANNLPALPLSAYTERADG